MQALGRRAPLREEAMDDLIGQQSAETVPEDQQRPVGERRDRLGERRRESLQRARRLFTQPLLAAWQRRRIEVRAAAQRRDPGPKARHAAPGGRKADHGH